MTPERITRCFGGVRYLLKEVTSTRRSAEFVAAVYRDKGFLVKVYQIIPMRFGIWVNKNGRVRSDD